MVTLNTTTTTQPATVAPAAPAPLGNSPSTGPAPAPATPAAATPAPAPAAAPKVPSTGKGATFTGITPAMVKAKQQVTAANVHAFVNRAAGGNYSNVAIVFIGSKSGGNPMPFANMQKGGKRAQILWAMVNGTPAAKQGQKPSNNLAQYLAYSVARGASKTQMLDLLAALNGGFSPSSKNWGTPYIKLVVTG